MTRPNHDYRKKITEDEIADLLKQGKITPDEAESVREWDEQPFMGRYRIEAAKKAGELADLAKKSGTKSEQLKTELEGLYYKRTGNYGQTARQIINQLDKQNHTETSAALTMEDLLRRLD